VTFRNNFAITELLQMAQSYCTYSGTNFLSSYCTHLLQYVCIS